MRKTKIVCTIGPATDDENILREMMLAGMNVARFNFSHGDYESQSKRIKMFKDVRNDLNLPIPMMLDTKGPEIRTGSFGTDQNTRMSFTKGDKITLTTREVEGTKDLLSIKGEGEKITYYRARSGLDEVGYMHKMQQYLEFS